MTERLAGHPDANRISGKSCVRHRLWTVLALGLSSLAIASPALAHHPLGGQQPSTFAEGLLSGFGHPVLGPDHLAFILALGLSATLFNKTVKTLIWIPVSFALATLLGVGIHLMAVDIPAAESVIASTVIGTGILLIFSDRIKALGLLLFGAIAGLFHGYAYGEAIVGAELSPLLAYLIGLLVIQVGVAGSAFGVGTLIKSFLSQNSVTLYRYIGLIFGALGIVLFGNTLGG